jgi:hypothetical protein
MGTKHYVEILKTIGEEGASWSKIKRYLELRLETKIYDSEFVRFLKKLVNNGFIEKRNSMYIIPDSIPRYTSENVKC